MLGSVQNLPSNKGPSIIQQQPQLAQSQQPQNGPSDVPPPPLNGQDFTLSNVLHFLQSEWRKYERDRNEWEIERAEMRVRRLFSTKCWPTFSYSLFLPGSHRSARGRAPLLREYQSRPYAPHKNARVRSSGRAVCTSPLLSFVNGRDVFHASSSKQLSQSASLGSQSIPPAKVAALQSASQKDETSSHKDGSSPSSPRSEGISDIYSSLSLAHATKDSPLPPERGPNGTSVAGSARASALAGPSSSSGWTNTNGPASTAAMGKPSLGRDPKSRARSREYLKQYVLGLNVLSGFFLRLLDVCKKYNISPPPKR